MAGYVVNINVCSPLKLLSGLKGKHHAICHYSYNLPLWHIIINPLKKVMKNNELNKENENLDNWGETDEKAIYEKTRLAYDTLIANRLSHDNLMWQTPLLCITAQSFLYTIALTSTNSIQAKTASSFIAVILGFAAIQLMSKHRSHEISESKKLEKLETLNQLIKLHEKSSNKDKKFPYLNCISSYRLWMFALIFITVFGLFSSLFFLRIWICN